MMFASGGFAFSSMKSAGPPGSIAPMVPAFSGNSGIDGCSNCTAPTGHEAVAVAKRLRARNLLSPQLASAGSGEGPMDATAGEAFVVERVGEVYPALWVTGMAVCATFGGPRMGPIFGGMLLSGKRAAGLILEKR